MKKKLRYSLFFFGPTSGCTIANLGLSASWRGYFKSPVATFSPQLLISPNKK